MKVEKYIMSFTSGALLYHESVKILEVFFHLKEWDKVRKFILTENTLQARTVSTLDRVTSEVIARLKKLHDSELIFFENTNYINRHLILWLAICRRYTFIGDFAVDVLYNKFISLQRSIDYDDFTIFFNKKAEAHDELNKLSVSTRNKLRQTLFKMLRESNLLDKNGSIIPATPSTEFNGILNSIERYETMFFPIPVFARQL